MAQQEKTKTKSKAKLGGRSLYDSIYDKEGIERSKTTLSTGGGEPIEKGKKLTTEKRVLQPRDPETGEFDYNASADIERKYAYHAHRNGLHGNARDGYTWKEENRNYPANVQKAVAAFYQSAPSGLLKKGQIMTINGQRFVASMDMNADEFKDMVTSVSHDKGRTYLSAKEYWNPERTKHKNTPYSDGYNRYERNKEGKTEDAFVSVQTRGAKPKEGKTYDNLLKKDSKSLPSVDRKELKAKLAQAAKLASGGREYDPDTYETPKQAQLGDRDPNKLARNEWFNRYAAGIVVGGDHGDVPDVPYGMDPMKSKSFANHVQDSLKKNRKQFEEAAKKMSEKAGREITAEEFAQAYYFKKLKDKRGGGK